MPDELVAAASRRLLLASAARLAVAVVVVTLAPVLLSALSSRPRGGAEFEAVEVPSFGEESARACLRVGEARSSAWQLRRRLAS